MNILSVPYRCLICVLLATFSIACYPNNPASEFIEVGGHRISYELIYQDVSNLLDVTPGSKEVFIRWVLPIRYYIEGLESYPEKAKLFDQVAQEMATLSGLDIQRHSQIYWPSNKTMFHPDSPDNRFTNAHFFFHSDFEQLANSGYIKAASWFGSSLESERERFVQRKKFLNAGESIFKIRHSGSNESLMYFNSYEAFYDNKDVSVDTIIRSWLNTITPFLAEKIKLSISKRSSKSYLMDEINFFDKLFLSTYYKTNLSQSTRVLKHGINNEQAAQMIAKEIWYEYQQLVAQ